MAKYFGRELRSVSEVFRMMRDEPYLQSIAPKKRKRLLVDLGTLASFKVAFEVGNSVENNVFAPRARAKRDRSEKAVELLRTALQAVQDARACCEEDLSTCEEMAPGYKVPRFTFAEIEKDLTLSVGILKAAVRLRAAIIPPKLRTAKEKRLAADDLPAFDDVAEVANTTNFPVTKSRRPRSLNTWFIHKAAECIRGYKPPKRGELSGLEMTIVKLFEAAFGDKKRNQDSVRKALKRRMPKGPEYKCGQETYLFFRNKHFSTNPGFLPEELGRSRLGYPRR